MRFTLLLFFLGWLLKFGSWFNSAFKRHIRKTDLRFLIKTEDKRRARLFIFNRGKVSSIPGNHENYHAALVWKDPETAFGAMISNKKDASFNASAEGKLRVEGMSYYAMWFEDGINLIKKTG